MAFCGEGEFFRKEHQNKKTKVTPEEGPLNVRHEDNFELQKSNDDSAFSS